MGVLVDRFEEHEGVYRVWSGIPSVEKTELCLESKVLCEASQSIQPDRCWLLEAMTTKSKCGVSVDLACKGPY